ncbi:hypothetical protein BDY24DRAFT_366900 [Mrakia frigida]|uniref:uncharacterized protein n=1 Tax=Mrakia frigida TaxID=29902 RepID=UPI003FCC24BD
MFSVPSLFIGLLALPSLLSAAPIPIATLKGRDFQPRATACFITGSVALPAEVESSVAPLLAAPVTCRSGFAFSTIPDVVSGGISYSSIDFQGSSSSPLGFALGEFTNLDQTVLQNQLNVYLAVEAGTRSLGGTAASAFLGKLKSPKFFLQFQIARVNEANGVAVGAAGTVAHQLQKVQKNSAGATA